MKNEEVKKYTRTVTEVIALVEDVTDYKKKLINK